MNLSFTSLEFILFLLVCLGLLHLARRSSHRIWVLILFSYLFCLTFGPTSVLVITATALAGYFVGNKLVSTAKAEFRERWLWVGWAVNLFPLITLKYTAFLSGIVLDLLHPFGLRRLAVHDPIVPVIGLSYFAFAGITYIVDVYDEKIPAANNLSEYVCYMVFFPKLIAGPIVRAADFLPQLGKDFRVTGPDIEVGCAYILVGAAKKLVIADQLASHVGTIMAAPHTYNGFTLFQGVIGYTVQIYADFSGYSDMAIGCAKLLGITFPQNFLMPYSSVNIAEFWRRWHVTMSTWFRDYVFLPLEFAGRGADNPTFRASRSAIITMLLCGLWHGASWNFVLWGGMHGVALSIYRVYANLFPKKGVQKGRSAIHPGTVISRALTLAVVMVGWILFGTQTVGDAFTYLWRVVTWSRDGVALGSPYIVPLAIVMFVAHLLINKNRNLIEELPTYSPLVRVLTYSSVLLALVCLVPSDTMPFAYVRF